MSLYPPIVEPMMPAFVGDTATISFENSPYGDSDIQAVHLVLTTQYTNESVLDRNKYPLEIKEYKIGDISNNEIKIEIADLALKNFTEDLFYKAQLRFSKIASSEQNGEFKAGFIESNISNFSEWSKPCLIKKIYNPQLKIAGFENAELGYYSLMSKTNQIHGELSFDKITKEYLYSYRIQITTNENVVIEDSGECRSFENSNAFEYVIKKNLEDFTLYKMTITYKTNSGYIGNKEFLFQYDTTGLPSLPLVSIETSSDRVRGSINVTIKSNEGLSENIMIRRASNKTNFSEWEDVHLFSILSNVNWSYSWDDYLVEPGVVYKYGFQIYRKYNNEEARGEMGKSQTSVNVVLFDDIFLLDGKRQLRIKYDPNISSFKQNILEARVETIGSKYPWIKRNSNVNYKTFPISGLITYNMDTYLDDYPWKMTRNENGYYIPQNDERVFEPSFYDMREYDEINKTGNLEITQYKEVIKNNANQNIDLEFFLEKKFRDEVMKFLQDGKVKVFKSETEGNMLIRLMDISFTPNKTLGRRIYSFSATAYEIDDYNLTQCKKYDIFKLGDYNNNLETTSCYIGQKANQLDADLNKLLFSNREISRTTETIQKLGNLKWFKITFNSKPYRIDDKNYGYKVTINGDSSFIIGPRGVIEVSLKDFSSLNSIIINLPTDKNYILNYDIDYISELITVENKETNIIAQTKKTKVGQLRGKFDIMKDIALQVRTKYLIDYQAVTSKYGKKKHFKKVEAINALDIEAPPGAVFCWKDIEDIQNKTDDSQCLHEIGPSGIFHAYNEDGVVMNFYFCGIRLSKAPSGQTREMLREREYLIDSNTEIPNKQDAKYHHVYGEGDNQVIYHDGQFYPIAKFSENALDSSIIVKCPIEALINYCVEVAEGVYQGND